MLVASKGAAGALARVTSRGGYREEKQVPEAATERFRVQRRHGDHVMISLAIGAWRVPGRLI